MKKFIVLTAILFSLLASFKVSAADFADTTEAKAYLKDSCIYDVLRWQFPWGMSLSAIANITSDDAVAGGLDENDQPDMIASDNFSLNDSNSISIVLCRKYYDGIRRFNFLIDKTSANNFKKFNAQGKFLRALFYFDMVRTFGKVALDVNNPAVRAEIVDVYAQIESDLISAIPNLPEVNELSAIDIDLPTKGAAIGLLGKVYLYQGKWSNATDQFNAVIVSGKYSLLANYDDLWSADNEHNHESIFEIPFTDEFGMDWTGHNKGNVMIQFMGIKSLTNNEYNDGWGFCKVTQELANAYKSRQDTIRFDATIIDAQKLIDDGSTLSDPFQYTGYYNKKYSPKKIFTPANSIMYAQNEIVLRYADILLMNAEAQYRLDNGAEALEMLNAVRNRANRSTISTTGTALFDSIVVERQLELALEGNRYFDLVRWGKDAEVLGPLGYVAAENKYWPYPNYVVITSIPNNLNITTFKGFPNPAKTEINLSYNLSKNSNVQIVVYSANGQALNNIKLSNVATGNQNYKLDLNSYQSGIYSVMLITNTSREVCKFSIIR
jgi:hypothetical protein